MSSTTAGHSRTGWNESVSLPHGRPDAQITRAAAPLLAHRGREARANGTKPSFTAPRGRVLRHTVWRTLSVRGSGLSVVSKCPRGVLVAKVRGFGSKTAKVGGPLDPEQIC